MNTLSNMLTKMIEREEDLEKKIVEKMPYSERALDYHIILHIDDDGKVLFVFDSSVYLLILTDEQLENCLQSCKK